MAAIGKNAAIGEEGHSRQLHLTDLPDEILIHILSLLPTTEDAVRTCLLLWRSEQQHLWKSLTRLSFRESDMLLKSRRFKNFVERVMCDHSMPLVSFTLRYHKMEKNDYANHINTWITKAVQFNLEELTLSLDWNSGYITHELPCCIFGCQSLVKLEIAFPLTSQLSPLSPSVICLPCLKYLRLGTVEFMDRESAEKLLSSPLLEELHLECVSWQTFQYISVCSPKLQILEILEYVDLIFDDPAPCEMRIIADNLKHFSYLGNLFKSYLICASSSTQLRKVEIDIIESMREEAWFNFFDLLKGLSGTVNLSLSDLCLEGMEIMSTSRCKIPLFEYVTRLNIRVSMKWICINHWALMKIYERCPHLEYLNIGKLSQTVRSLQLSPIPLCFQTSLKKILVHYYVPGDEEADAAIGVLLNSAFVLEELVIFCERYDEIGFHEGSCQIQELQDRFNQLPRVSKACVISVRVTYYMLCSPAIYYHKCFNKSRSES